MSRQGHFRESTYENIKNFWENEAKDIGETPQVTIRDHYFRLLELHLLLPIIPSCEELLDIGCGTGFGTLIMSKRSNHTLGVDFSENMIVYAQKILKDPEYRKKVSDAYTTFWDLPLGDVSSNHKIEFKQGNILDLNLGSKVFDVITGQRILINLPTHDDQLTALAQLRKYAPENGLLILTEATIQGHQRTDNYRAKFGLPMLEKYWHNNYVDEDKFSEWRQAGWQVEQRLSFDTYMLLSKVIYPAACGPDNCKFLSGANAAAMEMACIFRSKSSIDEIGLEAFFKLYVDRVGLYDQAESNSIQKWLKNNIHSIADWGNIGHQVLIIASAG